MDDMEFESRGDGEYMVRAGSADGATTLTLLLRDVGEASDGRLQEDEATARAAIQYLLGRQDASDLPGRVEVADVLAAYPDAVDKIEELRRA